MKIQINLRFPDSDKLLAFVKDQGIHNHTITLPPAAPVLTTYDQDGYRISGLQISLAVREYGASPLEDLTA